MMEVSAEQQDSLKPHWDRRFPGRFQWEMDAFAEAEVTPQVDQKALAHGRLELSFEWPLSDKRIPLRALYPDGYPHLRPLIYITDSGFFPKRHHSPIDGNLCLLGRDSRQWLSSWTVPELLRLQLQSALENGRDEDPQGEPAEVWWNAGSLPDSYCLIDSDWSLLQAKAPGRLRLAYVARLGKKSGDRGHPVFCAVVKSVFDADGNEVAAWNGPLPSALRGGDVREMEIPWERWDKELIPTPLMRDQSIQWGELVKGRAKPAFGFNFDSSSKRGHLLAFLYPTETQFRREGESWLFIMAWGKRDAFYPGKKSASQVETTIIRTLRAGRDDLNYRAPTISHLAARSVALVGTGAIGAPLAIELARNGIRELRLMDFDVVEPGNTIRWSLGSSAWGRLKAQALADFIAREYPATKVSFVSHCLGTFAPQTGVGDLSALDETLAGVDLIVDATASFGTTSLIHDQARSRSLPLVVLYASPSVAGGVVSLFTPGVGCPVCLEWAWQDEPNVITAPPGMFDEAELIQPPGCAERTFSGTFFDLQELSLQAMRVVAGFFASKRLPSSSFVYTLAFQSENGIRVPNWRENVLPPHPQCSCQK
ncbi:ThiF family adenylyltransferase [Bradyrhizobium sp. BWA-3-5]|uniref:ThiF family adenylyltransferase n=1 Tax=Bradyrhizobium sp. BWA-3-5 TaxID=3080013 RepID=UPI00293EAAEB|nr:ThiF family adenylyltransferase [Bradyrhizobium sp. BWA-3-5]WOH63856.1 ThiF family adenylyltransferase [Bradyrhizobium sp. BWA-3-5]